MNQRRVIEWKIGILMRIRQSKIKGYRLLIGAVFWAYSVCVVWSGSLYDLTANVDLPASSNPRGNSLGADCDITSNAADCIE